MKRLNSVKVKAQVEACFQLLPRTGPVMLAAVMLQAEFVNTSRATIQNYRFLAQVDGAIEAYRRRLLSGLVRLVGQVANGVVKGGAH